MDTVGLNLVSFGFHPKKIVQYLILQRGSHDLKNPKYEVLLTVCSGVVGLYVSRLDSTILNDEGVTFAPIVAKDGRAVKVEVQSFGKDTLGVSQEAELTSKSKLNRSGYLTT